MPEADLTVVFDPDDAPERTAFLRALSARHEGRVVAEVRPGARNLAWVGAAVLEGLGKDLNAAGTGRNAGRNWRRASDWLIGAEATDLFVSRVQSLSQNEWERLIELAAEVGGLRLWLIVQQTHLRQIHNDVIESWPIESMTWGQFEERWAERAIETDASEACAPPAEESFPQIPDDDFTTFLDTCDRVLPRSAAVRVYAAFEHGRTAVSELVNNRGASGWQSTLRGVVDEASTMDEAVVRIRGAQAALFMKGLWLRLDQRLFSLRWESKAHLELTPELLKAIDRFASPPWSALAALRALTYAGPSELAAVRVGEIGQSAITVGRRRYTLEGFARAAVLAQLAARARDGAGADDPLFTKEGNSAGTAAAREPLGPHGVQKILRLVGTEIGVELIERKTSWKVEDDAEWARRRGLVLRSLEEGSL